MDPFGAAGLEVVGGVDGRTVVGFGAGFALDEADALPSATSTAGRRTSLSVAGVSVMVAFLRLRSARNAVGRVVDGSVRA